MARVFIGVDPHKLSATIEVVDKNETVLASGRFSTDRAGYAAMRNHVRSYPDRVWAVEGSNGAGRPLVQRLLADGEHVVDVPAKLSARARLLNTGHNRRTDAHDAHAVAVVAARTTGLRVLAYDAELEALRMLVDRRDELSKARVRAANRLHRLLAELVPGQGKKDITTGQAKTSLATVRPRDVAGNTRRRLAAEQVTELITVEKRIKALTRELKAMVIASGSTLMELPGVGPVVAARTLADVGDVARFTDRNRFASWTGTAPIEASSGEVVRHRLSRAGDRRMNHMIHIAAATQIRLDTNGRAYYRRELAAGKTRAEAIRCLQRRISDALYRQLRADGQPTLTYDPLRRSLSPPGCSRARVRAREPARLRGRLRPRRGPGRRCRPGRACGTSRSVPSPAAASSGPPPTTAPRHPPRGGWPSTYR